MITPSRKVILPALLVLLVCFSCAKRDLFFGFSSFDNAGWDKKNVCRFAVPVTDTLSRYNVFLEIRNNNDYEFRNLWLFVDLQTPDGKINKDTLNFELADVYGKWYGKGISLYEMSFPYKKRIQFDRSGTYSLSIRHGMREDRLKGISAIAVRIVDDPLQ